MKSLKGGFLMHNIFNHRACEILGTCDIKVPDFPPIPGISDSTMSEVQRVLKIGHGTSVIDMFKEIGDDKDLLSTVISYLVATNKANDFINKQIDEGFHGFNDEIRDLLNLSIGKDDVDVAAIHDIAQLSAQAYAEKEDNGDFEDCSKVAAVTIAATGAAAAAGSSGMTAAASAAMIASSPELGRMACRRIYPEH